MKRKKEEQKVIKNLPMMPNFGGVYKPTGLQRQYSLAHLRKSAETLGLQ